MAVVQPDVEMTLTLLELAAGITAQTRSRTTRVNRHRLDVDSFKTRILVRDFSAVIIHPCDIFIFTEKYLVIIH